MPRGTVDSPNTRVLQKTHYDIGFVLDAFGEGSRFCPDWVLSGGRGSAVSR